MAKKKQRKLVGEVIEGVNPPKPWKDPLQEGVSVSVKNDERVGLAIGSIEGEAGRLYRLGWRRVTPKQEILAEKIRTGILPPEPFR